MNPSRHDRLLGMDSRITRRDFLNSTLLASGSALLGPAAPFDLLAADDWTGPGGVGDYARSNGNTFEVMNAAHKIRDHVFDAPPIDAMETREVFDCVIVGGGISGLSAALFFTRMSAGKRKCLVLENHPIFGGEAKRNEFIVDGQRLMAPQGSDHFQIPYPHSFIARFYDLIGVDISQFKYQTWGSSEPQLPLGRTFEQMPAPEGVYFGARFGKLPGVWLVDPWKNPGAIPIPAAMRAEMLRYRERSSKAGLPFEVPGDEKSRYLDSITLEQHLIESYGLSRETIRTLMMGEGGGFGAGPDALSGYCAYAFEALHSLDDTPETGWQAFPGGNCGIARHIVKTLIPDSIAGEKTLEAICQNSINFAALDRAGEAARIRLGATVFRVEHDTDPARSSHVSITYTQGEKTFRMKARSVVMAGGGWATQLVVRDLPKTHRDAYAEFHRMPCMLANVAVRNWRFMHKLGFASASWYEGLGSFTSVRKVPVFSTDAKTIGPDSPTVLTFKVLYLSPGLSLQEQGTRGRTELLSTSFRDSERKIREQLTEMFAASGFDARREIAGIILNRWGHAYLAPQPGFFFGKDGQPAPREVLRRAPFGRISFANTELSGAMDHKTAVLEAHRAVGQLLDQVLA
jgi:spermidine dehydrogenase